MHHDSPAIWPARTPTACSLWPPCAVLLPGSSTQGGRGPRALDLERIRQGAPLRVHAVPFLGARGTWHGAEIPRTLWRLVLRGPWPGGAQGQAGTGTAPDCARAIGSGAPHSLVIALDAGVVVWWLVRWDSWRLTIIGALVVGELASLVQGVQGLITVTSSSSNRFPCGRDGWRQGAAVKHVHARRFLPGP